MQVTVPRPDVKGRTEILKWYLFKIKVDPGLFDLIPARFLALILFSKNKVFPQPSTRRSSPGEPWASRGRSWRTWSTKQP